MTRRPDRRPKEIPPDTKRLQERASRPGASAWVSANAGSGKTTVLVRRVQRLLLDGADPGRILCLTYTAAAAGNMANRLFRDLRQWTGLDDAALASELWNVLGEEPGRERLTRARTLFALALETPGGLKIQTIHAFCTRLLQSAPFEAGVPPHFEVISESDRVAALEAAIREVLADPAPALAAARALVAADADDQRFRELVDDILAREDFLLDLAGEPRAPDELRDNLAQALGVDALWSVEAVEAEAARDIAAIVDADAVLALVDRLGSRDDKKCLEPLRSLAQAALDAQRLAIWREALLTAKGEPRQRILTAKPAQAAPDIHEALVKAQERLLAACDEINGVQALARSAALAAIGARVLAGYRARKDRLGALDYRDMIARTRDLFESGAGAWLLYKLDAGLDHLLVDEAQDTSGDQWAVMNSLAAEFFAGAGQRGAGLKRTIFAVGDEKQSIFGFQGAAPAEFGRQRAEYGRRLNGPDHDFHDIRLNLSFRSTRDVIEAVDKVFSQPRAFEGLSSDPSEVATDHQTTRGEASGAVDLWELVEGEAEPDDPVWERPLDALAPGAPVNRLAGMIADTLKRWIADGCDDLGAPFDPDDALILLPKRNAAFEAVVRALKLAGVPVAGMDRIVLADHAAIEDLVAAGRAALLPQDDLTLAEALVSPLIGLTDDDLIALCAGREGSLAASLAASREEAHVRAAERLAEWRGRAGRMGPFGFYSRLLASGGRLALAERLGAEASDAVDAFLARALDHERREGASLAGFLDAVSVTRDDIRRDLAEPRGEVRVMTVHGAKGLEAPVVFIADVGMEPQDGRGLLALPVASGNAARAAPVWSPRKACDNPAMRAARLRRKEEAVREHHRLLYVAMTRAEDRLIVCGVRPGKGSVDSSWHGLIRSGLGDDLRPLEPLPSGLPRWRYKSTPHSAPEGAADRPSALPEPPEPGWLRAPAPDEAPELPPLSPSRAGKAADMLDRPADDPRRAVAAERGRLSHLLLQWLPSVEPDRRARVAASLAARHGAGLDPRARAAAVADALRLIADPRAAELFGPDARAEAEIGGVLVVDGVERHVSGRVDRLAVAADRVIAADFKTAVLPPADAALAGPETLTQLAVYRELLRAIWPDHTVEMRLIYTTGPLLFTVGDDLLDGALAALSDAPGG